MKLHDELIELLLLIVLARFDDVGDFDDERLYFYLKISQPFANSVEALLTFQFHDHGQIVRVLLVARYHRLIKHDQIHLDVSQYRYDLVVN